MKPGLPRFLIFVLAIVSVSAHADTGLPAMKKLAASGASVSALVVDLPSGKVLAKMQPQRRLTPASLTKLYLASAALTNWSPGKTFSTRILAKADPHDGIVKGDLVLLGGGDATLSYPGLWQLAAQLRDAGVKKVTGDLVINESLFGAVACVSADRCDARSASRYAYDAPLSSAGINFGTWCVAVAPADHPGSRAHVRLCPFDIPDVTLHGHVKTVAAGHADGVRVSRTTAKGHDRLFLSGTIAADSPVVHVYRSVSSAPMQTGWVFGQILRLSGIKVAGKLRVAEQPPADGMTELAHVDSITLAEQLRRMMTYSNNYMADTLALDLLSDDPDVSRPLTLEKAGDELQTLALATAPRDDSHGAPVIHSGSGLTPDNALSAADIVSLLKAMYLRTDLFPAFLGSLTVPKFSPLTIFQGEKHGWLTRIAAKTGSLEDPVTVLGVAGYFRKQDGGWGAFALIINGSDKRPHIPFADGTKALRDDVNRILADY